MEYAKSERRAKCRYPLTMAVHFFQKRFSEREGFSGVGEMVNMSSTGLLLRTETLVPVGARLKLVIDWPALLNGVAPLHCILIGKVIRSTAVGVSVTFTRKPEFRTRGKVTRTDATANPRVSVAQWLGGA
jgi:hypothetical protein